MIIGYKKKKLMYILELFTRYIPDEIYLKILYLARTKSFLNLKNPRTYNEKVQWLKLHDRKKEYGQLVDKYEVKKYVADIMGEECIIPTLGVWDRPEDIDRDSLPDKFVLKCTHDSGSIYLCENKETFDWDGAIKDMKIALKRNFYYKGREYPYKYVKPRIIAEKYMVEASGHEITDFKFYCFGGEPEVIEVDMDRYVNHRRNFYDKNWKFIDATVRVPNAPDKIMEKPVLFDEMMEKARILSKGFKHLRVDFYEIDGKLYFGELTFYHVSGMAHFEPESFALWMGDLIDISETE